MERRVLGKTGQKLSIVGFGGIVVMNEEPAQAKALVSKAIDRGITYFDVAPSYGNSEEKLGPALQPYRKKVFLACKTTKRTAKEAEAELQQSLSRMKTDHFDLYQHHGVTTLKDVETLMGPGGAMETFVKARERGAVKFIGFSAHTEEAALALMDKFDFDSVLFPFNWACWLKAGFGKKVLEKAQKQGIGRLALKTLARQRWEDGAREKSQWPKCWYRPVESYEEAVRAMNFTLSKDITAAVSPSHADLLWWMCDAAEHLRPLSPREEQELAEKASGLDLIFPHAF